MVSHVTNPSREAQEVMFEIRLPEKAFIHNFSMTVGSVLDMSLDWSFKSIPRLCSGLLMTNANTPGGRT